MPAIIKGNQHMQAVTYVGNGSTQTIYVGFKSDFLWFKSRSATGDNKVVDSVRGISQGLITNSSAAATTDSNGVIAITDTGFILGSNSAYNTAGVTYVVWCWKAGQGITSTNTSGSITSTVSVNKDAGFSIVSYTGTGVNATVGHGLDVTPTFFIIKNRTGANGWVVYHAYDNASPASGYMRLDASNSFATDATVFNNTIPLANVFSLGILGGVNTSTNNYVAYCFAPIAGYSAFGSYTGNGSADGPFVYLGFRPKFVLIKKTSAIGGWLLHDTVRSSYNVDQTVLIPNLSDSENVNSAWSIDELSNGFKVRATDGQSNENGGSYIYAAFAENPFQYSMAR